MVSQSQGYLLGVPILRSIIFRGLHGGPPIREISTYAMEDFRTHHKERVGG